MITALAALSLHGESFIDEVFPLISLSMNKILVVIPLVVAWESETAPCYDLQLLYPLLRTLYYVVELTIINMISLGNHVRYFFYVIMFSG